MIIKLRRNVSQFHVSVENKRLAVPLRNTGLDVVPYIDPDHIMVWPLLKTRLNLLIPRLIPIATVHYTTFGIRYETDTRADILHAKNNLDDLTNLSASERDEVEVELDARKY
jgi:hypothetical protein